MAGERKSHLLARTLGSGGLAAVLACLAAVVPGGPVGAQTPVPSCTAVPLDIGSTAVDAANPAETPCVSSQGAYDNEGIAGGPLFFSALSSSTGGPGDDGVYARAAVGQFDLSLPLSLDIGISTARSFVSKSACSAAGVSTALGVSQVAELAVNGVIYEGTQPRTIAIPGVATIYLNRQVVIGDAISQTAVLIDLAQLHEDIAVATTEASYSCS